MCEIDSAASFGSEEDDGTFALTHRLPTLALARHPSTARLESPPRPLSGTNLHNDNPEQRWPHLPHANAFCCSFDPLAFLLFTSAAVAEAASIRRSSKSVSPFLRLFYLTSDANTITSTTNIHSDVPTPATAQRDTFHHLFEQLEEGPLHQSASR
jgi:hypothetical protein